MASIYLPLIGQKILKATASLKLAVVVILSLGVISTIGTVVESRYGATTAQQLVYHSPYMYAIVALLCVNLIGVMVNRWPWKRHHTGFILAHTGIIITILGAWVTKEYGIDGSLQISVGQKNRFVILPQPELTISSSFMGTGLETLFRKKVHFLKKPPEKYPLTYKLAGEELRVTRYWPYAVPQRRILRSKDPVYGPAVRFQLFNDKISQAHWLLIRPGQGHNEVDLGPAKVILSDGSYKYTRGNVIVIEPLTVDRLRYKVYSKRRGGFLKQGVARAGDVVNTGWTMGLQLRLISFLPRAKKEYIYQKKEQPIDGVTTSAIEVDYRGEKRWLGMGAMTRYFLEDRAYVVSYRNTYLRLGFDVELKDFRVGRYKGSMRAASYESDVFVEDLGPVTISMNNPLKHQGFTFYQSSFQEAEPGRPYVSIFSVNQDPGRYIKYLGCLLIVLGTIVLFYFKRMNWYLKKNQPPLAKAGGLNLRLKSR